MDNKTLIEIAHKSGFSIRNNEIFSPYYEDSEINDLLEAFMVNIVRECADIAQNHSTHAWDLCNNISEEILYHFNINDR